MKYYLQTYLKLILYNQNKKQNYNLKFPDYLNIIDLNHSVKIYQCQFPN